MIEKLTKKKTTSKNKTNTFNLIKSLKGTRNGNNFCRTEA